ncbi:MAG TPA: FmdB family zinc ribbon protein [Rubrobacteraceae bacterium]|jgi:putative FmdB family regulatory protein|nr:FmdB family zinc ribbon protein [Rubrobacteraceae bacterium]
MPIYEYKCENGHVFDVLQKMSDNPLTECRECGASVRKVLQPVGISFKGSGFYSTDYNSKAGPKSEPKEAAAASTTGDSSNGSSSGSSSEKKPEKASTGAKKED